MTDRQEKKKNGIQSHPTLIRLSQLCLKLCFRVLFFFLLLLSFGLILVFFANYLNYRDIAAFNLMFEAWCAPTDRRSVLLMA